MIWLHTLGLIGIGWIIDAFLIPGMNDAANRRYRAGRYDYSVAWLLQTFLGPVGIHRLSAVSTVNSDSHRKRPEALRRLGWFQSEADAFWLGTCFFIKR